MPVRKLGLFLILPLVVIPTPTRSATAVEVTEDRASLDFPESVTFSARMRSQTTITSVVLEYGSDELTCGTVIAKAFPQITPDNSVEVAWTWEMRQSGSLPPGATIWWRWRVTGVGGGESLTETKTVTWLDEEHNWQTLTGGDLRLHWYRGDQTFASSLLDAALAGLERLEQDAGLAPDAPIDLYIYANTSDMQDAILYEPSWTGGVAFPEHNIVISGIGPSELEWGTRTEVHELTHVLVGHLTFSCLGVVPTWLNEGLAVYSEGELDPYSAAQLEAAIADDELLSVRSLSGGFSEVTDKAYLSYSQSYSLVEFLIEAYGREKMNDLLLALRDGATIDDALRRVYGFDVDGLEDAWRAAIGAQPRPVSPNPTAIPTPTHVPTIAPISGAPLAVTPTPLIFPTPASTADDIAPQRPPPALTLMLAFTCCVMLALFAVLGLGLYFGLRGPRREK